MTFRAPPCIYTTSIRAVVYYVLYYIRIYINIRRWTVLVINSVQLKLSWEATGSSSLAIQESPVCMEQNPTTFPFTRHTHPVDALGSCDLHFDIILPSTPRSSEWSRCFRFPHQNSVCVSLFTCSATRPVNLILLIWYPILYFCDD